MTEQSPNTPATVASAEAAVSTPAPPPTLPKTAQALADKEKDLIALRDAAVEAASVSGPLWVTDLGALFYLAIAAGAVTHKDLFLENPVKLPFLNVELPLTGFFGLGPAFFLILHTYVLLHFVLLAGKVGAFHRELEDQIKGDDNADRRANLRHQLPSNIFIQFLAGPKDVRFGLTGWLLRGIAWISLVFGPVLLLVFFQLRFLPYHHAPLTWWHRFAVLLDILLLWWFWPKIAMATLVDTWRHRAVRYTVQSAAVLPLALVFCVASFPGEWLHTVWQPIRFIPVSVAQGWFGVKLKGNDIGIDQMTLEPATSERIEPASLHELLLEGAVDQVERRPSSPFANVLILPGAEAYDPTKFDEDKKFAAVSETRSLRGRHLEGAVLINAKLRKVDLTGAFMERAILNHADLREARLLCADRGSGSSDGCAQLQGTSLISAQLQGASLDQARLQGAVLDYAQMQGTSLSFANLQGTSLSFTKLHGASLLGTQLQGASLDRTRLQGTMLSGAQLQGATVVSACVWRARLNIITTGTTATQVVTPRLWATNPVDTDERSDSCDWSPIDGRELRNAIVRNVSAGGIRDAALWRLDRWLLADTPEARQAESAIADHWERLADDPPNDADFVSKRRAAGCDAANAPHVTRGLLRQINTHKPQPREIDLAKALLDPATCPGAAKLTDDDKAQLTRIRDSKPGPTR